MGKGSDRQGEQKKIIKKIKEKPKRRTTESSGYRGHRTHVGRGGEIVAIGVVRSLQAIDG
jgi:hypothetical protein